jgi:hypothetical protein
MLQPPKQLELRLLRSRQTKRWLVALVSRSISGGSIELIATVKPTLIKFEVTKISNFDIVPPMTCRSVLKFFGNVSSWHLANKPTVQPKATVQGISAN